MTRTPSLDTHDILLTDGVDTVGLILVGSDGKISPDNIQRNPYPRTSTKFGTGETKYSDFEVPYSPETQEDFSSGRGADIFEDDTTRFADSFMANTEHEKQVILGPLLQYYAMDAYTGFNGKAHSLNFPTSSNNDLRWLALYSTTRFRSNSFDSGAGYTAQTVEFFLSRVGSPANLQIHIYSDSGGDPSASQANTSLGTYSVLADEETRHIIVTLDSGAALSASTTYHVVFDGTATADATDHWVILGNADANGDGKSSSDGSSWTRDNELFFRVAEPDGDAAESTITRFRQFEYKRAMYCAICDGTNTEIYMNGDRGAADSNSGQLSRLNDSLKTAWSDSMIGGIVLLIDGPGSSEETPYRVITGGGSGYVTVSPDWKIVHTTATSYVILNVDFWQSWHSPGAMLFDSVEVAGEYVYFGSEDNAVYRYREFNNGGAWNNTADSGFELVYAKFLKAIQEPGGLVMHGGMNQHPRLGKAVWKSKIPPPGSNAYLYSELGTLVPTDKVWTQRATTNVDIYKARGGVKLDIAAGFATGILATKDLDQPVDITGATHIAIELESSINCSSGDLKLLLDDTLYMGQGYLPDILLHFDAELNADETYVFDNSETGADQWEQYPDTGRTGGTPTKYMVFTLETSDYIYIGCAHRFGRIKCEVPTVNAQTAALTGEYWRGDSWQDASITDGTASGGVAFAQDGDITFSVPTNWQRASDTTTDDYLNTSLFWFRIKTNANLDLVGMRFSLERGNANYNLTTQYNDLNRLKDGDSATADYLWMHTDDYILIGFSEMFDTVTVDVRTANAISATMAARYFDGSAWSALTLDSDGTASGGATLAQDGDIAFTPPSDWAKTSIEGNEEYYIQLYPSADLTEGMALNEITVSRDHTQALTIPALVANTPKWCVIAITSPVPTQSPPTPDHTNIRSVGLRLDTNLAAQVIHIYNVKYIVLGDAQQSNLPHQQLPYQSERITNLIGYGEPQEFLYIWTEGTFYYINEEGALIPSPLGELRTLRSEENALAAATNDVYLYLNLGPHLEQYHEGTLVDIGPNRDAGLPAERRGIIRKILSLAGGIIALVDPEDNSSNYWSILSRRNGGWHEIYRSPRGARIYDMFFQVIPGDNLSRLWVVMNNDIMWIPFPRASLNPLKDSNYLYCPEITVTTGWITANFLDIQKLYTSLKTYSEQLGTNEVIRVHYQEETGNFESYTSPIWTEITDTFDTSPFQEISMTSDNSLKARRIRLRFMLRTGDITTTPVLKAWVLEQLRRFEVKNAYSLSFLLPDQPSDLQGYIDFGVLADADMAIMDNWGDSPTALTMTSRRSAFNNKTVIIEPIPLKGDKTNVYSADSGESFEAYLGDLAILEL